MLAYGIVSVGEEVWGDDGEMGKREGEEGKGKDVQPVQLAIVRKGEDELVDDAVDAEGAAQQLHLGVGGVVEDEVVAVWFTNTSKSVLL